jgi:hypothetical protein
MMELRHAVAELTVISLLMCEGVSAAFWHMSLLIVVCTGRLFTLQESCTVWLSEIMPTTRLTVERGRQVHDCCAGKALEDVTTGDRFLESTSPVRICSAGEKPLPRLNKGEEALTGRAHTHRDTHTHTHTHPERDMHPSVNPCMLSHNSAIVDAAVQTVIVVHCVVHKPIIDAYIFTQRMPSV